MVFRMLCLYKQYKCLFPQVILNYSHRTPQAARPEPLGPDDAEEVLRRADPGAGPGVLIGLLDLPRDPFELFRRRMCPCTRAARRLRRSLLLPCSRA